jgi:hypothetical protein
MTMRALMPISCLALGLALSASCGAQVMQRVVVPPAAPTTPQQTQSEPTAAEQATGDEPVTDPAGVPSTEESPPAAIPAPTSSVEAQQPAPAGQGVAQGLVPAPPEGLGMAAATPMATLLSSYERLPGCAKRISIASLTQIYVIGCSDAPDTKSFHWESNSWKPLDYADAHSIAAVEDLRLKRNSSNVASGLFFITADGVGRFAYTEIIGLGGAHASLQEAASGGGWIWAINAATSGSGHLGGTVRRSDGVPANCDAKDANSCTDHEWSAFGDLYAKRITAGLSDAVAWVIGEDGKIYRQVNTGVAWIEKPGCATAIANAGNDNVWIIGCDAADGSGNRNVYQWDGGDWVKRPGSGVEIAIQADGKPWLLQADGGIWRHR